MEQIGRTRMFDHSKLPSATGSGDIVFLSTKNSHLVGNVSEVSWRPSNDYAPGARDGKANLSKDKARGRRREL